MTTSIPSRTVARLKELVARRFSTCKEILPLISESLDHRLTWRQRVKTRLHLLVCTWCVRYQQQQIFIQTAMRRRVLAEENAVLQPQIKLSPQARERMKKSLV